MTVDTGQLRARLRNIDTRAAAIDAAAECGAEAVSAVLPLLGDRHEGVRWSAIRILAEIGDERAVAPLLELLEKNDHALYAARALKAITGVDLGVDPKTWRRWLVEEPARRNRPGGPVLSDADLVRAAAKDLPVQLSGEAPVFIATVSLPEGQRQDVWIDFSSANAEGRPIVQLITPCGDADPGRFEAALIRNMTILYGAVAIASIEGRRCFVIVNNHLRETAHPSDVAESIMSLARHGAAIGTAGI